MVARLAGIGEALRNPEVVSLLAGALLAAGIYAPRQAPLEVFPESAPPVVEVQVESPGLAAEDVEALVTRPLERALGGAPELATLRSSSTAGLAVLTAIYSDGTDPYRARQVVIERLALTADQLPAGTRPAPVPLTSALTTILVVGLRADPNAGGSPPSAARRRRVDDPAAAPRGAGGRERRDLRGRIRQLPLTTTPERLWAGRVTLDALAAAAAAVPGSSTGAGSAFRPGSTAGCTRRPTWSAPSSRDTAACRSRSGPLLGTGALAL